MKNETEDLKKQIAQLKTKLIRKDEEIGLLKEEYQSTLEQLQETVDILKLSEEKYRLLYLNAGIIIGFYKPDGTIISYNINAAQQMQGTPEGFTGKKLWDIFDKELADTFYQRIQKTIKENKSHQYEDMAQLPSGEKWFDSVYTPIYHNNNNLYGIQVISYETTNQKNTEAELKEKNDEYEALNEELRVSYEQLQQQNEEYEALNQELKQQNEKYATLNEEYQTSIEELQQKNNELHIVSEVATALNEAQLADEVYQLVISKIYELNPDAYLIISALNKNTRQMEIKMHRGFSKVLPNIVDVLGFNPSQIKLSPEQMSENERKKFAIEKFIRLRGGIHEFSAYTIDENKCAKLEDILQVDKIYSMGCSFNNMPHCSMAVITKSGCRFEAVELTENIVKLSAITLQQIQAKQELEQSEKRYRSLLQSISDSVYVLDKNWKHIIVNDAAAKFTGFTKEQLLNSSLLDLFPGVEKTPFFKAFQKAMHKRVAQSVENEYNFPDGRKAYYEVNIYPVTEGILCISKDITDKVENIKKIENNEKRLKKIIENMPVMLDAFDHKNQIIAWNKECEKVTGYSAEEITKHPNPLTLLYPDKNYLEKMNKDLTQNDFTFREKEWKLTAKDGTERIIVWNNNSKQFPIEGWTFWATGIDITERKKAENALRESEQKYRQLYELAGVGIGYYKPNGDIISFNNLAAKHIGCKPNDVAGKNIFDLFPPENAKTYMQRMETCIKGNGLTEYEDCIEFPVGKKCFFSRYAKIVDNQNNLLGIQIVSTDITDRKQAEIALKDSELRWKFAIEGNKDGLWDWNLLTDDVFFSEQWKKMIGYEDHEMPNKLEEWDKRVHPDDKENAYADINRHRRGETDEYINEHRMRCKDGSYKWILDRGKIISFTKDNQPARMIGTHSDITPRKLAEKALRESEAKFREIYYESPIGIELYNEYGELISANKQCLKIFGVIDANEIQGFRLFENPNISPELLKDIKKGKSVECEMLYDFDLVKQKKAFNTTRTGTIIIEAKITPLKENKKAHNYLVHVLDITERKKAEKSLRESESKLKRTEKIAHVGSWDWDIATDTVVWSDELFRIFKIPPNIGTVNYTNHHKIYTPESLKILQEAVENTIETGIPYKLDLDFVRGDGTIGHGISIGFAKINIQKKVVKLYGSFQDITERKKAEKALVFSEQQLKEAQKVASIGSWRYNIATQQSKWSDELFRIIGIKPKDGEPDYLEHKKFIHTQDWPVFEQALKNAIKTTKPYDIEIRIIQQDTGKQLWIKVKGQVIEQNGKTMELFGTAQNITEQKNDREKLRRNELRLSKLNATKDKLFSIIGHDLKGPLGNIAGFAELLENKYETFNDEKIKKIINLIYKSSISISNLLDNLLTWSRTQRQKLSIEPENLDMYTIVNECFILLSPTADKKQISLKNDIEKNVAAFADKEMITTVIRNLITNAIKFTETGGEITAKANYDKNMLVIAISDTGIGIEPGKMDRLFDLDKDFSSTGTAGEKGTGLGLIICKEFVEQNKGKLWVESQATKGSTFSFSLPTHIENE